MPEQEKITVMTPRGKVEVIKGSPFVETIKEIARNSGLKTMRVFVGEFEVLDPSKAPETIDENVTLYPFDTPAR